MELRIKGTNIYVAYNGQDILDLDDIELYDFDHIGLVGVNGAGKSTLLKALAGEISISDGVINRYGEFAYIPQLDDGDMKSDVDFALMGKLGVHEVDVRTMSGGEETRLKIAQAFSSHVHGIFADEPTSHLDREGIDFLISQFKYFAGALLVVSHDRYFLDEVVSKIWELKDGKIIEYWGNYSDYLMQKEEEHKAQTAKYEKMMAERERLEKAAEKKRQQAKKMEKRTREAAKKNNTNSGGRLAHQKSTGSKQKSMYNAAKSIEHKIESMDIIDAPENSRSIRFRQSAALALHNPFPITANEISKCFGTNMLFEKVSFTIPLGAKVAITGDNGSGKTTLLKMISNRESGIEISSKAAIGYFSQDSYKSNLDQNVLAFLMTNSEYNVSEIRSILASMGFKQADIGKTLAVLSGGEMIKLKLAEMLLGKYNILLMDEPSNYLDLTSLEALEKLMVAYTGTIIFVSHDKRLVDHVADVIYNIEDRKLVKVK